ncbi:MAG: hypothetical protein JWN46_3338 [Acidimicrobiales bacterium]|nr:hypothetical protein [Acidimicrobiales bacterium]
MTDAVLLASRALVAIAARSMQVTGDEVTLPQYRALVVLRTRGPQTVSSLATELGTAPSSVTRLCDRLIRKHLVRRAPGTVDRREVSIEISDAGTRLVGAVMRARRREITKVVQAIPAGRRKVLVQALEEFGQAAGEVGEPDWSTGWAR